MSNLPNPNNVDDECSDDKSEASSISFHSMQEKLETLNVEDCNYQKPINFSSKDDGNNLTEEFFETAETYESIDNENCMTNEPPDKYFVDEEFLKDLEIPLTDDEKKFKTEEATDIKKRGNEKFKQNLFEEAATLYTDALRICPMSSEKERAILYSNRAAARSKLETKEELKGAIKDCDIAIEIDSSYLKALLRRANLHQQLDNLDEALKDFKTIIELDPSNTEAKHAITFLPQQIEEKNEKLKEEMMGKLKDLGNLVLKPFGLSTNNFQLNQDSKSGGYNISFNQNSS